MPDPLSMARMRVNRTAPVPLDASALSALREAADFGGRRVIDVQLHDGTRVLMLGWPADCDPAGIFGEEPWSARQATPSVLLTLAASLRCCWRSPDEPVYPGEAVPEEHVLEALEQFTHAGRGPRASGQGARPAWKGALRSLRACGLLAPDEGDHKIRLGPEIAKWGDAEIRQIRDRYDDLPGAGGDVR
jgi:hypothetical protein